ncbi:hypothetical protein OAH77_04580, partial [Flavobacteriaceae bacterium]|nr:hypothetical protein [Flavobacteriaceae bacterium]
SFEQQNIERPFTKGSKLLGMLKDLQTIEPLTDGQKVNYLKIDTNTGTHVHIKGTILREGLNVTFVADQDKINPVRLFHNGMVTPNSYLLIKTR